jgi:uncharacterized membrane protein
VRSNSRLRWKTRLYAATVVVTNVTGNFALGWGMKHGAALDGSALSFVKVVFDPFVFLGILLLSGWVLSRMALLSWADLSYVIPVTSIGFVLNAVMGAMFLDERITPMRWMGTLCIVAGTVIVGRTDARA